MYKADELIITALQAERAGDIDRAVKLITEAHAVGGRQTEGVLALNRIAKSLFAQAMLVRDRGNRDAAIALLVRSVELNPQSGETRAELKRLIDMTPRRDLTKECFIHPDRERATRIYREAIQTALDFAVFNGVPGDILEFGVLGGWTARHFAELGRDSGFLGRLCLFDSFEGLPKPASAVDQRSHDMTRGIWRDNMALPKAWISELGKPFDEHIADALALIISRERIRIHKGFFSETLKEGVPYRAAIVHFDCDLYQSTVEVFQGLVAGNSLQDGTILLFDDWNCNRGNPAYGQRRALHEFLERHAGQWDVSHFFNYGHNCAAFILHDLAA